jgi:hypothetical protein
MLVGARLRRVGRWTRLTKEEGKVGEGQKLRTVLDMMEDNYNPITIEPDARQHSTPPSPSIPTHLRHRLPI